MKAEDFLNQRTPKLRGSKLAPAWPEIRKLREAGCSLYEIQEFLKTNNIETSVPNLAAFIKRQNAKNQPAIEKPKTDAEKQNVKIQNDSAANNPVENSDFVVPESNQLDEALKSRGAVFDTFEQNRPTLKDRFNKPKGTK